MIKLEHLKVLWSYRAFILASVRREFQLKYQNSLLGAAWSILNPLSMIVIYTVIFSQIMKARLPGADSIYAYSVYLCAGIIAWNLFSEMTGRFQNVFLENANALKKLDFPKAILFVIVILNSLLNFVIIGSIFLFFLAITGQLPGWEILLVIPVLILQMILSIGLGLTLGVLNVFFRDVGHLFNIVIQFWFWLTPIVYSLSMLPDFLQRIIMLLNPMAPIIEAYHNIFVYGLAPDYSSLMPPLIVSIVVSVAALFLYTRHVADIVDEL